MGFRNMRTITKRGLAVILTCLVSLTASTLAQAQTPQAPPVSATEEVTAEEFYRALEASASDFVLSNRGASFRDTTKTLDDRRALLYVDPKGAFYGWELGGEYWCAPENSRTKKRQCYYVPHFTDDCSFVRAMVPQKYYSKKLSSGRWASPAEQRLLFEARSKSDAEDMFTISADGTVFERSFVQYDVFDADYRVTMRWEFTKKTASVTKKYEALDPEEAGSSPFGPADYSFMVKAEKLGLLTFPKSLKKTFKPVSLSVFQAKTMADYVFGQSGSPSGPCVPKK